ncbi:hypothetical protein [uncultured Algoriphagus sp.]|uniref:hypothetical protein n=1 Tax=uncultured Algoriphagus sp. TaxID=417365 RepID=UPI0030EDC72B|tara:strand:+ start:26666 stop:27295 length:630 start_codon:yes stop_codon:yes gene_type:complete
MIPDLYRGDSDPKGTRYLRHTLHHYQLQTNLIKGGEGRKITESPIVDLVDRHVSKGWNTTHFLSFSSNLNVALRFGIGCEPDEMEQRKNSYSEDYFGNDSVWDFAILKIETVQMTLSEICKGAYSGIYQPTLLMFQHLNYCRVMLIDVGQYLSQFDGYEKSKANAKRDSEWLILPANPLGVLNEFSASLDGGNFLTYQTFKNDVCPRYE